MSFEDWDNSYNDSEETIKRIQRVEDIISIYGRFPTFEDAEILELTLNRGNTLDCIESSNWDNHRSSSLSVKFYLFDERYDASDPRRNPTHVSMLFSGLGSLAIDGFNHQNAICGVGIREQYSPNYKKNLFRVDWGGAAIAHKVSLTCELIEIHEILKLKSDQETGTH